VFFLSGCCITSSTTEWGSNKAKSPNLYQFSTLRLFIEGIHAFGTISFEQYGYASAGNKAGYDANHAILDKIHDLRNRLFDHLLHFMDQVFQD
jgi:hypothetical protein